MSYLQYKAGAFTFVIFFIATQGVSAVSEGLNLGSENSNTSIAQSRGSGPSSVASSAFDSLTVGYTSTFEGPMLSDFGTGMTLDTESHKAQRPLNTKNELAIGYKLAEGVTFSPVFSWDFQPAQNYSFEIQDPYVKLSHERLAKFGPIALAADIRVSAPISEESRMGHLLTSIASEQALTYAIPQSNFLLTLSSYFQRNLYQDPGEGNMFEYHFAPTLTYQIRDQLSATLTYELTGDRKRDAEAMHEGHHMGSFLKPGISWDITPSINFNPHLHIRACEGISADRTTLGATFNWVLI